MQCDEVCCSVLQHIAVYRSVLQCVAVCCSVCDKDIHAYLKVVCRSELQCILQRDVDIPEVRLLQCAAV